MTNRETINSCRFSNLLALRDFLNEFRASELESIHVSIAGNGNSIDLDMIESVLSDGSTVIDAEFSPREVYWNGSTLSSRKE